VRGLAASLIADEDNGVTLDPGGLSTITVICRNGEDSGAGLEGDCVRVSHEPWNND